MAIYSLQDINTSVDGDLEVSKKGDLDLASSLDTYKNSARFLIKTDYGDYAPQKQVGCNLGSYIGSLNVDETHFNMKRSITDCLSNVFSYEDYDAEVVPFDLEEVLCVIFLAGTYFVDNEYQRFEQERITFTFPFLEGSPTEIVIT